MKNIRPKNVTASSTRAVVVTPVTNASSGSSCSRKKGIDERTFTRSLESRAIACSNETSRDSPGGSSAVYLLVGRQYPRRPPENHQAAAFALPCQAGPVLRVPERGGGHGRVRARRSPSRDRREGRLRD